MPLADELWKAQAVDLDGAPFVTLELESCVEQSAPDNNYFLDDVLCKLTPSKADGVYSGSASSTCSM
eukprot:1608216-Heterocapsa_arctica.AAC.1